MDTFKKQLARLPFMAALIIAVAGMPLDVYAYNEQGLGHAHAAPWLQRAGASLCSAVADAGNALASLRFWQIAIPIGAACLMAAGVLPVEHSGVLLAGITIDDLLTQKREKVTAANEIRDRVYGEQAGEWRGDDEAKFDGLMTEVEKVSGQIERMAKLDAAAKSLEDGDKGTGRRSAPTKPGQQPNGRTTNPVKLSTEDRALVLHGWFARGTVEGGEQVITERHMEAAQRAGIRLDSKSLRIRLSDNGLDGSCLDIRGNLNPAEIEKRLTQSDVVSPDLGGHYTVPDEMMKPLEVALLQFGGMRQVATILRTATGADLPMPTLNDTSNKGRIVGQGVTTAELDTEFEQLILNSFKYTSDRVPVSVEYLQDNAINFVGRIGAILGERIGRITNDHFTTGTGNSQPKGIVVAATSSGVTTASATALTHDELIDLKHSVDPAYREQGARWMFNDTTLKTLKKIKVPQYSGDTVGTPLWRAGLAGAEPNTIDGDPYTINQSMASAIASQKAVLYGLLSKYQIRDVKDITLVRLDERYAELGVVAFLSFSRHDGDLLDAGTHPVKYLTMHS